MKEIKPVLLISACLCGIACRYNGGDAGLERLARLLENGLALAVCPEVDGGLPVPRQPCELVNGRALACDGRDFTGQFEAGAALALALARAHGIRRAVLKEKSPSCAPGLVYDGSFSGRLAPGEGITAALLRRHGIAVFNENELEEL